MEESKGVQSLIDAGWETKAIAAQLGKSPTWVVRRARLTKLSKNITTAVLGGKSPLASWPAAYLELLASLPTDIQDAWLKEHAWMANNRTENIPSFKDLKWKISQWIRRLSLARWALDDAGLSPKVGACIRCNKRSSCVPGLFSEFDEPAERVKKDDLCLDAICWQAKAAAAVERQRAALAKEHGVAPVLVNGEDAHEFDGNRDDAISPWGIERCKKTDKSAKPYLVVSGSKTGEVFWARGHARASLNTKSSRPLGADGKPEPRPLVERRRELNLRREALVNPAVAKALQKIKWADAGLTEDQLWRLVAVFGTNDNNNDACHGDWGRFGALKRGPALAETWEQVRECLASRLVFYPPNSNVPTEEHEEICKLLKIDLAKLRAEAAVEIPEPKSWAHLKADGSPKAAAPAKAAVKKPAKAKKPGA